MSMIGVVRAGKKKTAFNQGSSPSWWRPYAREGMQQCLCWQQLLPRFGKQQQQHLKFLRAPLTIVNLALVDQVNLVTNLVVDRNCKVEKTFTVTTTSTTTARRACRRYRSVTNRTSNFEPRRLCCQKSPRSAHVLGCPRVTTGQLLIYAAAGRSRTGCDRHARISATGRLVWRCARADREVFFGQKTRTKVELELDFDSAAVPSHFQLRSLFVSVCHCVWRDSELQIKKFLVKPVYFRGVLEDVRGSGPFPRPSRAGVT